MTLLAIADNQEGWMSHKHAMRGVFSKNYRRELSVAEARQKSNAWVREQYSYALYFKNIGDMDSALFYFGKALHTLQDETSPAHIGFQLWNGDEHWYQKGFHGIQELFYWQTRNTQLDSVTRKAYNWFKSGYLPGGNLFSS